MHYMPMVAHAWLHMMGAIIHTCMGSHPSQYIWGVHSETPLTPQVVNFRVQPCLLFPNHCTPGWVYTPMVKLHGLSHQISSIHSCEDGEKAACLPPCKPRVWFSVRHLGHTRVHLYQTWREAHPSGKNPVLKKTSCWPST